jgi:hypothetical protein
MTFHRSLLKIKEYTKTDENESTTQKKDSMGQTQLSDFIEFLFKA